MRQRSRYFYTIGFAAVFTLSAALFACGGGGGGSTPAGPGRNSVATAVSNIAPAAACPNGGITVDAGIDANGNGILDPAEVTSTQYVCNGANGSSGLTTLVAISTEPSGSNCAAGGNRVDAGQDANANGVLDAGEVSSTAYVCNGANGTNGIDGTNGSNSLVSIVPEPSGIYCTYGGNKVSSGVDSNKNGVLDAAEVSASSYVCDGAPGATGPAGPAGPGITWQDVTGTGVQAVSNTGYLANNASAQVQITLPAVPTYGDIIQVSGVGAGGWKIAQNAGQSIVTQNLPPASGVVWTPREAVRLWTSVASSDDGTKLVATMNNGYLFTSTNSGVTWTQRGTYGSWYVAASSSDGTKLAAAIYGGTLYTSGDSGVTWTPRESARSWRAVASSADGTKLAAGGNGTQLYTSSDSGVTWTPRDAARNWMSIASSADGTKLAAADYIGMLYTSTDSGVTWTPRESARYWWSVASSADGSRLAAAGSSTQIYISVDSGVTWTSHGPVAQWGHLTSSADGRKLAAATQSGQIYISSDYGVTWTPRGPSRWWTSVASSADGSKLVATSNGGPSSGDQIYTSTATVIPATTAGTAGSISGGQYDSMDLQYIGGGTFMVRGYAGYLAVQ